MSRTPIRQALWSLRAEGLVVIVPAKGAFVSQIVLRDVAEAFQLREGVESWAAR